jgi:HlyD family secretion protein
MSAPTIPSTTPAPASVAPKKKSRKRFWIIIASLVVLAAVVGAAIAKNKGKEQGIPVTVEKAFIKTITQVVTATGKIQPETEVKISPEVGGEIIAMPVQEGATVRKGDVLLKIKPDFYQAQVEQMEAALASA